MHKNALAHNPNLTQAITEQCELDELCIVWTKHPASIVDSTFEKSHPLNGIYACPNLTAIHQKVLPYSIHYLLILSLQGDWSMCIPEGRYYI